jgi:RNA polymerase sigma-70 factor (ECF subfamily)
LQRVKRLFEEHKDMVYRVALSYTGNTHDAQDVCQEVFLRLIKWIDRIKEGAERGWLTKVTVNCCKNLRSSYSRCNTRELLETDAVSQPKDDSLIETIMLLPGEYRIVVYLFYYEEYSTKEIAKLLHISQSAVTTRLHRARQQLRRKLKEEFE